MTGTVLKLSMAVLLVASAPAAAAEPAVWAQWGLAGTVVGYVLWRDAERERRLAQAIERQQAWIRTTLLQALEHNATAMERMVHWLERQGSNMRRGDADR